MTETAVCIDGTKFHTWLRGLCVSCGAIAESSPAVPEQTVPDISRCLCSVCIAQRKGLIDELSKEEQFDSAAWHKEPMIGWSYRYLGYMPERNKR